MTDSLPFGRWLKQRRKALDLTQEVLAERVGCAVTTISKIEVGVLRPSRQLADLLAGQLELAPAEREAFLNAARARPAVRQDGVTAPIAISGTERPPTSWPMSLLVPPTALIGRSQEVESVCALLLRADVRLLTLTGAGGAGKTRVALQVAAELHDQFADGVAFVALASISDPTLIVATIAQALRIKEADRQPLFERVQNYLRTKQMLLLLDNFEHVVAAALSIAELLAVAPRLKVLVTSRDVLHLSAEQEFPIPTR
jgi:transcriptional regulator with XRE-family HTH domain